MNGTVENGNSVLFGLPKWARGIASVSAVTILVVMAIYFVYLLSSELRADSRATSEFQRDHSQETAEMKRTLDSVVQLNRLICVNTSQDVSQRNACLSVGGGR